MITTLVTILQRLGLRPDPVSSLTVKGRKTGKEHTVQVRVISKDGQRWLVAPYGAVNWVKNIRVSKEAVLRNGRRSETVQVEEVAPQISAPVLQEYLKQVAVVRSHFTATPQSPLADFEAEAARHPVFRVVHATPQ